MTSIDRCGSGLELPRGSPLAPLKSALDHAPQIVSFWWRDDDAGRPDPRLGQLLALATRHRAPIGLAVVPAWLEPAVASAIQACDRANVLQHGWCHVNRSADPSRPCELVADTLEPWTLRLVGGGRELLAAAFGTRFLPIMVPPWNQIDTSIESHLTELGFVGVSALPEVPAGPSAPPRLNAHLDLVEWPMRRWHRLKGIGLASAADRLAELIAADRKEPLGILSHHLVMDAHQLDDLDRLLAFLVAHPKARLLDPAAALAAL